jgi:hypothetical protein
MEIKKYANLVRPLSFRQGRGGANAKELVFVSGEEMAGFDFNFIVGVYDQTGDWAPGRGAHLHPFDECLLFFGYDPDNLDYLGSEMELCLGKELEKHKFNVPTVAIAPKGVPHCPLVTEKVYRPFGHFHLALNSKYSSEHVDQQGTTDGTRYAHLVKKMAIKKGPGGANSKQVISISGAEMEGVNLNFEMGLHTETGEWHPGKRAHVHPYDEATVFFGHNTDNLSYLGAELAIEIGEEREQHTFNVPTVVSIPKGLPHFPLVCNKLDRPYRSMQVGLAARYESKWLG